MHGELLEAERGETLHMMEVVREAAEARAALQSCEAELAQWRETAEGAHEPPWGLDEWLRPFANARLPQGLRAFSTRPGCSPVPE